MRGRTWRLAASHMRAEMLGGCELIVLLAGVHSCHGSHWRVRTWNARRLQIWINGLLERSFSVMIRFAFCSLEIALLRNVLVF